MVAYSWQLTLVVWAAFVPMMLLAPRAQKALSAAYGQVRVRMGALLGAISVSVVGAATIRAYGAGARTGQRDERAISGHLHAAVRAQSQVCDAIASWWLS